MDVVDRLAFKKKKKNIINASITTDVVVCTLELEFTSATESLFLLSYIKRIRTSTTD